jgi:hypothetical protein
MCWNVVLNTIIWSGFCPVISAYITYRTVSSGAGLRDDMGTFPAPTSCGRLTLGFAGTFPKTAA